MTHRVVVTGLGLVTPVGTDVDSTWASLLEGRSGAGIITKFDPSKLSVRFACEVKGFDASRYMDKKEARRYDLFAQFALGAAAHAAWVSSSGTPATSAGTGDARAARAIRVTSRLVVASMALLRELPW